MEDTHIVAVKREVEYKTVGTMSLMRDCDAFVFVLSRVSSCV